MCVPLVITKGYGVHRFRAVRASSPRDAPRLGPIFGGAEVIFGGAKVIFGGAKVIFGGAKVIFGGAKVIFGGAKVIFGGAKVTSQIRLSVVAIQRPWQPI